MFRSNNNKKFNLEDFTNTITNKISNSNKELSEMQASNFNKISNNTNQFFNLKNIAITLLIIFILAVLGFNIFFYLSQGTDFLTKLFKPFGISVSNLFGETTKTTVDNVSQGTKDLVSLTADTTTNIIDNTKQGTDTGITYLQNKLINNQQKQVINKDIINDVDEPQPIDTKLNQSGFCYIGKVNDTRYCAKVSSKSQCMSGDIYPSEELCINPNLRQ